MELSQDQSRSAPPPALAPLLGLKVIDVATLFAGPLIATLMADFGAEVIKIEHPRGDALRALGGGRIASLCGGRWSLATSGVSP